MMTKEYSEERLKIIAGLELAYKRLVAFKKLKRTPMVVSSNGKIVKIQPEQLRLTTKYSVKLNNS